MERTPNTSHTLIQTLNRLRDPLQRLSARVAKQQGFLQNLVGLHVAHANGFLFAADVFAFEDGVAAGSGRDCDFDLGVVAGESLELGFEEGAGKSFVRGCRRGEAGEEAYFIPLLLPAQSQ
jgi:hypothetical protein